MKRKKSKVPAVLLGVAAVLLIGGWLAMSRIEASLNRLKDLELASVDLSAVGDGAHEGSYAAFPVSSEVRVIVTDHAITAIDLVKHTHGQGAAAEAIPDKVLASQSIQVDAVAGATYSSMVILKAIENALLAPPIKN